MLEHAQPGLTPERRPLASADATKRPEHSTHERDAEERDRELEREADQERGRREQERHLARVNEAFDVLLAREADRRERRDPPRREPAEAPVLDREADEREGDEHRDDLGHVREVLMCRPRRRACQTVREGVGREDARRREGSHEEPGDGAASHVRG